MNCQRVENSLPWSPGDIESARRILEQRIKDEQALEFALVAVSDLAKLNNRALPQTAWCFLRGLQ